MNVHGDTPLTPSGRAKSNVAVAGGAVLYAIVLRWIYVHVLIGPFGYLGLTYAAEPSWVAATSMAVTALSALFMPRRITRASDLALWVIWFVCAAPTMLMSTYTGYLDSSTALMLSCTVAAGLMMVRGITRRRTAARPLLPELPPQTLWIVLSACSLLTYALMAVTLGLQISFVDFDEVYDVRSVYHEELAGSGLLPYLISPQAYVINPLFIARGITTRRPLLVVIGVVGQMLIYSSSGLKIVLFSVPAILLIALVFSRRRQPPGWGFVFGPVTLMLVCVGFDSLTSSVTWTSLFTRRFLATPGVLSSAFVEFFSQYPQAHLGHSILKPWVEYPYGEPPSILVGQLVIPGSSVVANASVFADGFANFGWIGILGASALLAAFLRILDRCCAGVPLRVVAMTLIVPSIVLSNSALLTSFLSHGLLASAVLLAIAPRDSWQPRRRPIPLDKTALLGWSRRESLVP